MRSLWPREHGAYAQLGFPLATGLVLGAAHPAGLGFSVAAIGLFLAHEPMAVIAGTRGIRIRDALTGAARRRLWLLGALSVVAGASGLLLAPRPAWLALAVPVVPAAALVPLFLAGRVKSLPGETMVATASSGMVFPLALSGGASWAAAGVAAGVWLAAFVPSIVAVHAVKSAHKGFASARWLVPATTTLAVLVLATALLAAATLPPPAQRALAALPPALAVLGVGLIRPHPRHLARIGWTMAAAYVVTLILLLGL